MKHHDILFGDYLALFKDIGTVIFVRSKGLGICCAGLVGEYLQEWNKKLLKTKILSCSLGGYNGTWLALDLSKKELLNMYNEKEAKNERNRNL